MHHAEHIQAADGLDRIHGHVWWRSEHSSNQVHKTENPVFPQDRRQFTQGGAQTAERWASLRESARSFNGTSPTCLRAAFAGHSRQLDGLGAAFVIPHIEGV